jgi:hypothetical protein
MKVELKDVTLAYSELTKKVYLVVNDKNGFPKDKKDITLDFHLMVTNVLPEKRYTLEDVENARKSGYGEGVMSYEKNY